MRATEHASFPAATEAALDRAAALCAARGAKLTDLRRLVLGLVLTAEAPQGAYDLLETLRGMRRGAAPPTVYRALDFLLEHALIHKLERLSAYIGCLSDGAHAHPAQFLICRACGRVEELDDADVGHALARAARRAGFALSGATMEAEGTCADCATQAAPLEPRAP